jgi:hypothetical protein
MRTESLPIIEHSYSPSLLRASTTGAQLRKAVPQRLMVEDVAVQRFEVACETPAPQCQVGDSRDANDPLGHADRIRASQKRLV